MIWLVLVAAISALGWIPLVMLSKWIALVLGTAWIVFLSGLACRIVTGKWWWS